MATYDPMDLDLGSQAFYRDFYHFHKNSGDAWYIKDANHRFVDVSTTFHSRFLSEKLARGNDHGALGELKPNLNILDEFLTFESQVISRGKSFTLFTWKCLTDIDGVQAFILKIKPLNIEGKRAAIFYVDDVFNFHRNRNDFLDDVLRGGGRPSSKTPCIDFIHDDQLSTLTEREWEVAWLAIYGKPQRWIADFLQIKRQAVERKLKTVYLKLRVFDLPGLILLSEKRKWFAHLPPSLVDENPSCFSI